MSEIGDKSDPRGGWIRFSRDSIPVVARICPSLFRPIPLFLLVQAKSPTLEDDLQIFLPLLVSSEKLDENKRVEFLESSTLPYLYSRVFFFLEKLDSFTRNKFSKGVDKGYVYYFSLEKSCS